MWDGLENTCLFFTQNDPPGIYITALIPSSPFFHHHSITIISAIIITVNDGRYVACALPWDGRVSVIQTFCGSKRRAQNEHLQCIARGALYKYTQTHKMNTIGVLCKYTETYNT